MQMGTKTSSIKNMDKQSSIVMEYARENKQNKVTAKQYEANAMEQQAEATEKLHCKSNGKPYSSNGNSHQEHNRSNERNDGISKIGKQTPHEQQ
jgi:hypothetical protein